MTAFLALTSITSTILGVLCGALLHYPWFLEKGDEDSWLKTFGFPPAGVILDQSAATGEMAAREKELLAMEAEVNAVWTEGSSGIISGRGNTLFVFIISSCHGGRTTVKETFSEIDILREFHPRRKESSHGERNYRRNFDIPPGPAGVPAPPNVPKAWLLCVFLPRRHVVVRVRWLCVLHPLRSHLRRETGRCEGRGQELAWSWAESVGLGEVFGREGLSEILIAGGICELVWGLWRNGRFISTISDDR